MGFKITEGVLMSYIQEEGMTSVVIPDGVKRIAFGAFVGCANITFVTMPDSVTSIGDAAFGDCIDLETITLSKNITKIPELLFEGCSGLKSVMIPERVTNIGNHAFYSCTSLTSVTIPESVRIIGSYVFSGCKSLKSVTIPHQLRGIGHGIFDYCDELKFVKYHDIVIPMNEIRPSERGKVFAMIATHDFTTKMKSDSRYTAISSMFKSHPEDTEIIAYIKKNFTKMFRYLIDENDIETIEAIIYSEKFLTKRNIDKMIDYAIEKERHEIYVILLNYKAEKLGFKDIADQFKL